MKKILRLVLLLLLVVGEGLLVACNGTSPTPNMQATIQAAVGTQLAALTQTAPTPNYPATIAAQSTQIGVLQATAAAPTAPPPTAAPVPTPDDTLALRHALAAYLAWPPSQVDMSIGEIRPDGFARGSVRKVGEMEGAAWFAAKVEGVWMIAYVGQGVPPCNRVNALHIPVAWADFCTQGNHTVHR